MGKEIRFIDPAFRCEVVLSGVSMALYEASRQQFERLKDVRNLGLGSFIHEIAIHTRHQHLVGLMRIFNKLCQQPKIKGLPKDFLWSFWGRICFSQTGHAAMSYDSEKAVLLACSMDSAFKAKLRAMLQPAIDKLAACSICTRPCPVKDKDKSEADQWWEQLVSANQWKRLHLWIAALKLVHEPKVIQILKSQEAGKERLLGFSEPEFFKLLLARECTWNTHMRQLARLDYVVRDLAFAGTLGIQLDVDGLVAAACLEHPDWGLLSSLGRYMSKTLYESLDAQTASVLYQRALAAMLVSGKIGLEALFGIDIAEALSDDDLYEQMKLSRAGREVFDPDRRRSWRAWQINTYIDPGISPYEIERRITGYKQGYLSQHILTRATCFKMQEDHYLALAISHRSLADRPTTKGFVKLCRSILKSQHPELIPGDLNDALFEGLFGRRCAHTLDEASARLGKLNVQLEQMRKAADVVINRTSRRTGAPGAFSIKIGDYEYPALSDPRNLEVNVMHAALSGNDEIRKKLDVSIENASEILWYELLRWQTEYFGLRPSRKVISLIAEAQKELARKVIQGGPAAGSDLELYALLEALGQPDSGVSFRVVLPNLKVLKDDGTDEGEFDVVSIVLKNDKDVEFWVWGVTTEANIEVKRAADLAKIERLKDVLGRRWADDIKMITCYIHKDGTNICREIEGRKTCVPVL